MVVAQNQAFAGPNAMDRFRPAADVRSLSITAARLPRTGH